MSIAISVIVVLVIVYLIIGYLIARRLRDNFGHLRFVRAVLGWPKLILWISARYL